MELIEKYLLEKDPNYKDGLTDVEAYKLSVSKTGPFVMYKFEYEIKEYLQNLTPKQFILKIVYFLLFGYGVLFILLFIGYLIDPDAIITLLNR